MKIKRYWYAVNTGWEPDKYDYILRDTEAINIRNGKPYFRLHGYCEESGMTHIMDVSFLDSKRWVIDGQVYFIDTKEELFKFKNLLDSIIIDEALK